MAKKQTDDVTGRRDVRAERSGETIDPRHGGPFGAERENVPESADRLSIDERVGNVFSHPEPGQELLADQRAATVPAEETAVECFLREAREAQAVFSTGAAVSPDRLRALVGQAIGLLSR